MRWRTATVEIVLGQLTPLCVQERLLQACWCKYAWDWTWHWSSTQRRAWWAYTDHTGYTGNSCFDDDKCAMCFNAAKTWQLGWHDSNKVVVDPRNDPTTVNLVGIANFYSNSYNLPIVVRIASPWKQMVQMVRQIMNSSKSRVQGIQNHALTRRMGALPMGISYGFILATRHLLRSGLVRKMDIWGLHHKCIIGAGGSSTSGLLQLFMTAFATAIAFDAFIWTQV